MMKLTLSPTSPYVRKARAVIIERGLGDRVELVPTDPWNDADPLPKTNPLGRVPALVGEDGEVYAGSSLVVEYLDSLEGGRRLYPAEGSERFRALRLYALAEGILDSSINCVIELLRRPEDKRWTGWVARQHEKIRRTLDVLEPLVPGLAAEPTIGEINLACALGYLDLRLPDLEWRKGRPALAAWYEEVAKRPSLAETVPPKPA